MARPRFLTEEEIEILLLESDGDDFSSGSDEEYSPQLEEVEERVSSDSSDSESEQEGESVTEVVLPVNVDPLFVSKDKTEWSTTPITSSGGRERAENVITLRPGVTRYASSRITDVLDSFLLFLPPPMQKIIIDNTNAFGRSLNQESHIELDIDLLHAYMAVLILAGVYK